MTHDGQDLLQHGGRRSRTCHTCSSTSGFLALRTRNRPLAVQVTPMICCADLSKQRCPRRAHPWSSVSLHEWSVEFSKDDKGGGGISRRVPRILTRLEKLLRRECPDLVITDFEPSLPRAALRCGIPFISLNHQHFLVANDLSKLPAPLRRSATFMGLIVGAYYSGQAETIVSSFYFPPLKPWYKHVKQIGVLLRPQILGACRERGKHLLAYIRKDAFPNVIEAFRQCGRPVRIYGLGNRPAEGNLDYRPIDDRAFVEDLATCGCRRHHGR